MLMGYENKSRVESPGQKIVEASEAARPDETTANEI
jgi:hypothetical protein